MDSCFGLPPVDHTKQHWMSGFLPYLLGDLSFRHWQNSSAKDFPFCSANQTLIEDCQKIKARPPTLRSVGDIKNGRAAS
jgi:hypothetical protein